MRAATVSDTFEARKYQDVQPEPVKPAPKLKLIAISHDHSGVLHVLREDGRLFMYHRDPHQINLPGVYMTWTEIVGP